MRSVYGCTPNSVTYKLQLLGRACGECGNGFPGGGAYGEGGRATGCRDPEDDCSWPGLCSERSIGLGVLLSSSSRKQQLGLKPGAMP